MTLMMCQESAEKIPIDLPNSTNIILMTILEAKNL